MMKPSNSKQETKIKSHNKYKITFVNLLTEKEEVLYKNIKKGDFIYNASINFICENLWLEYLENIQIKKIGCTRDFFNEKIAKKILVSLETKYNIKDIKYNDYNTFLYSLFGKFVNKVYHIISICKISETKIS